MRNKLIFLAMLAAFIAVFFVAGCKKEEGADVPPVSQPPSNGNLKPDNVPGTGPAAGGAGAGPASGSGALPPPPMPGEKK